MSRPYDVHSREYSTGRRQLAKWKEECELKRIRSRAKKIPAVVATKVVERDGKIIETRGHVCGCTIARPFEQSKGRPLPR